MNFTNDPIVETLSFPGIRISLYETGIVHINYLHGSTIDVKEKILEKEALSKITKGIKHPILVTFESYVTITKEAKEYSILVELEQPFLATAIVVDNIAYQLMADFYFKFYKPKVLYKVFSSNEKAVAWLLDVKNNPPSSSPSSQSKSKGKISFWNF